MSRAPEDTSPTPDDSDGLKGEDNDGPAPDGSDSDTADTADTSDDSDTSDSGDDDADGPPAAVADPNAGRPVDDNGVPLNYLGDRQGEHPFADMGEYIPMGGDRSNGLGSYDQRVAPLIADHNPWGSHSDRAEFNANHRPDGTFRTNIWPPHGGAVPGSQRQVTLPEGTVIDRFGADTGQFLSPMGTDGQPYHYRDRAIFPDNAEAGYHVYVVADPNGLAGTLADVAPALGQPGGGRQFTLPDGVTVKDLVDAKILKEVHVVPSDGRVLPDSFGQDRGDGTPNNDTVSVDDARDGADATPDSDTGDTGDADRSPDAGDSTPPLPDNLQQIADQSSFRTPAGGALFDTSDTITRNAANAVTPIDGHFVLDVHSDGQHAIVNGQRLNGADLADLARHMGWNGTDPIVLNACEAGRNADGLAADLAQASGAQVIAPTERSWSGERNTTPYSASVDSIGPDGRPRPTIPPDGGWRAFEPDGSFADTGSNGLPVDTQGPGDTAGSPDDGPTPTDTQGESGRQPVDLGDVSRGPIQSPFVIPPDIRNANDPTPIIVDNNAAATANPNDPTRPLRSDERLIGRTGLTPDTAYRVDGRGTYYTDHTGRITHADLEVGNERDGIKATGVTNPDATYPEPRTTYRVDVDGATHTYTTDRNGLPPMYNEWRTPRVDNSVPFPSNDPNLPANSPLRQPLNPREALSDRTGFPPYTQITYTTPHGTTTLYTGAPDPVTGHARVEAIDTYSSPDSGRGRVNVDDLNPELNNFPPNTVTRINGEDVYVTNDHGVTHSATDARNYALTAPRSSEAQDMVASLGTGTDGGHIRPTQAGGAPDARNQFPQDSDENRPQKGQPSRETWYGQDMEAGREQNRRGTTMLWHDFQTEGSHSTNPAQPTVVHERWVMQQRDGTIRIHFRRYDN